MVVCDRIMDRSTVQHDDKYSFSEFCKQTTAVSGNFFSLCFSSAAATAEMSHVF